MGGAIRGKLLSKGWNRRGVYLLQEIVLARCEADVLVPQGLTRALAYRLHLLQLVQQPARAVDCSQL